MYSTKRKFHNLLNSLTNSTLSPEAKRRRTTQPYSALLSTRTRPSRHGIQMSKRDDRSTQTTQTAGEQRRVANYAPWDRGQFLSRLKTFRHVDKWSAKPAKINEVQWAKRGWCCVGKERVACLGGCGKEVCVMWEERNEGISEGDDGIASLVVGAEEGLVRRYAEMIVTEHDIDCPWRKHGCDDTIYRLPLHHPPTAIGALASRYKSLVTMESELPSNVTCPEGIDMNRVMETLPEDFPGSSDSDANGSTQEIISKHIKKDAFALAILGWEAETGHIKGLVTCNACFRRLGLWLFQKGQLSSLTDTDGMQDEAAVASLDVVSEHRDYCPWINPVSQDGDKPGWELLVNVLRTAHHFRSRSSSKAAVSAPQVQQGTGEQGDPSEHAPLAEEERSVRDQKDKERFARLRKLKKVFDVKSTRKAKGKDIKRKLVA